MTDDDPINAQHRLEQTMKSCFRECQLWREWFVTLKLSGALKYIPDHMKVRLHGYFMCIPSDTFVDPDKDWVDCLSALLQNVEKK